MQPVVGALLRSRTSDTQRFVRANLAVVAAAHHHSVAEKTSQQCTSVFKLGGLSLPLTCMQLMSCTHTQQRTEAVAMGIPYAFNPNTDQVHLADN
jgi:low temperature requirement protein LtrA